MKTNFDDVRADADTVKLQSRTVYDAGRDKPIGVGVSKSFEMLEEDQVGHRIDRSVSRGSYRNGDFFNWQMSFGYKVGENRGEKSGFTIGTRSEMAVLCRGDFTEGEEDEVFRTVTRQGEVSEAFLGCEPRSGARAILRVNCPDGETRYFGFDGSASVWDWPENGNPDPTFKWHELKLKDEPVAAIKGPPPRADGTPGGFEPLNEAESSSNVPDGWTKLS